MAHFSILIISLLASSANGATLAVPSVHATIQAAWIAASPGDSIDVNSSAYSGNERVLLTNKSGTVTDWITIRGVNGRPVMRGFDHTSVSNINLLDFEVTHANTTVTHAFIFRGTCQRITIEGNYVHETHGKFVHCADNAITKYITIRNNTNYWLCHPGSYQEPDNAVQTYFITGDHWLVEYNSIIRSGDYFVLFGSDHIIRNNIGFDTKQEYWVTNGMHWDGFQPGSDQNDAGMKRHLVERNIISDLRGADGHFGIWQNTVAAGDSNVVIRGNLSVRMASGAVGAIGTHGLRIYNNTFFQSPSDTNGGIVTIYSTASINHWVGNNICADIAEHLWTGSGGHGDPLIIDTGSSGILTNNLGWRALRANGTVEESYVSTADPLFVNTNTFDFRLQAGSPAINTGTTNMVRITSGNGSGTSFDVDDGYFFSDGWGICEGDVVTINGTTTRIVSIATHTITVADSVTWLTGDAVLWGRPNGKPEIGAYADNAAFLTSATMLRSGTTYTVTPVGDARGVWFYVDGIPTTWDYTAPYQTDIASGTVTAKAFAEWAQWGQVVNATDLGESGSSPYRNKGRASRSGGVLP